MKKLRNYKSMVIAAAMAILFLANVGIAYASDDDNGYSFTIKAHHGNTYSDGRYRQTTNTSNPWKVNMTYSSEGAGTIMTYWLAKFNSSHDVVSGTHDVKQGTGAHYFTAYSGANQTKVCLAAENNNDLPNSYTVSGYWDEETY